MKKTTDFSKLGYLGFLGFLGFGYFIDKDPNSLFWFSFFAHFVYFFVGKFMKGTQDEMLIANRHNALVKTFMFPTAMLFIIAFIAGYDMVTKEMIIIIASCGYAVTILLFGYIFWRNERV